MISSEFQRIGTNMKAWYELFQNLQLETHGAVKAMRLTNKIAASSDNAEKNRYTNVLPYDQNRVMLHSSSGDSYSDYINASPVTVEKADRRYILSQGPVSESVADFWQMIYENEVPAIVMLNRLYEGDMLKCEKYFPKDDAPKLNFEDYTITLESEESMDNFVVRRLKLSKNGSDVILSVLHVQYTEWPDFGVPKSTAHFLDMLNYIKGENVLTEKDSDAPVVVHCSAGIGRSGTFVLVDAVLRMVELGVPQSEISVNRLLVDMRVQRMGLIQTPEQLRFAWHAIVDALAKEKQNEETAQTSDVVAKKRKSESQEDMDERMTKRREQVARMVAKSREAEERSSHSSSSSSSIASSTSSFYSSLTSLLPTSSADGGPVSASAILLAGAVAITGLLAFYLYRK